MEWLTKCHLEAIYEIFYLLLTSASGTLYRNLFFVDILLHARTRYTYSVKITRFYFNLSKNVLQYSYSTEYISEYVSIFCGWTTDSFNIKV